MSIEVWTPGHSYQSAACIPELYVLQKPVSAGCLATFRLVLLLGGCCFSACPGLSGGRDNLLVADFLYVYTCTGLKYQVRLLSSQVTDQSCEIDLVACRAHVSLSYLITNVPSNKRSKGSVQNLL